MNKDEALKMAIEALEWLSYSERTAKQLEAIDACKEALEQPAQEPVAWYGIGDMYVWKCNLKEDKDATLGVTNRPKANNENWKPLYTQPAQPLSNDEIWDLVSEIDVAGEIESLLVDFGRMVEQAHGIGVVENE